MATVGQVLAAPEAGWKRIESNYANLNFSGSWIYKNDGSVYFHQTNSVSSISFKFYGTKLRVISAKNFDHSTNVTMTIDGNTYTTSLYAPSVVYAVLIFENTNLSLGIHEVTITNNSTQYFDFDAIDIDDIGCLLHPKLGIPKTSLAEMQIGDYVPCRYTAASGAVGAFSELGTCNMAEIPLNGSATPNGLFNFIKVDKGLLIADRVVQHSISWNALNAEKLIEGNTIQQTSLVLKVDGSIKDVTKNYPSITINSGVSIVSDQLKINASSIYFNGTSTGIIQLPPNNVLNFGLRDFTIDFWFKWESRASTYPQIFCGTSSTDGICIGDYGGYKASYVIGGGSSPRIYSTSDVTDGNWYHYAICRKDGVFYLFINGKLEATNSAYTTKLLDYSVRTMIGGEPWSNNRFKGWVDEFRIVKGVALWTSDFTPNTTPYTGNEIKPLIVRSITGGEAYLGYKYKSATVVIRVDDNIKDVSEIYDSMTMSSGVSVSESQFKVNTKSIYFNGTSGNSIQLPSKDALNFGLSDFTIHFWFKWESRVTSYPLVFTGNADNSGIAIGDMNGNKASYIFGDTRMYSTSDVTDGNWYHYAVCRKNGVVYLFINGNLENTNSSFSTKSFDYSHNTRIGGAYWWANDRFKGWVDEFTIVKGEALWTESFTPSITPQVVNEADRFIGNSLTDKGMGVFPSTNEWDKYIINSDLGGKITAGDNNIWNINAVWAWTQNTALTGTWTPSIGSPTAATNASRVGRGNMNSASFPDIWFGVSTTSSTSVGFRPVLQYIEPDGSSKQTTLWY